MSKLAKGIYIPTDEEVELLAKYYYDQKTFVEKEPFEKYLQNLKQRIYEQTAELFLLKKNGSIETVEGRVVIANVKTKNNEIGGMVMESTFSGQSAKTEIFLENKKLPNKIIYPGLIHLRRGDEVRCFLNRWESVKIKDYFVEGFFDHLREKGESPVFYKNEEFFYKKRKWEKEETTNSIKIISKKGRVLASHEIK